MCEEIEKSREKRVIGHRGDELWAHVEFEVPVSNGDFRIGKMELGEAQEKFPMSQSTCFSAKVSKDWVGHMKGLPARGELERAFKKEMPWREIRKVMWKGNVCANPRKGQRTDLWLLGRTNLLQR